MDKDDVFELFEEGDSTPTSNPSPPKVKEKKVNPIKPHYIKIGMFTKIIANSVKFQSELEQFLKDEGATNGKPQRESSYFKIFTQAWECIKDIDVNQIDHLKALKSFDKKVLTGALKYAIWYFEAQEEYLKCAHLFKLQSVLKRRKK